MDRPDAATGLGPLTNAEHAVLRAILQRKSNAQIARDRGTSPRTVANQVARLFKKAGARSRADLAARVQRTLDVTRIKPGQPVQYSPLSALPNKEGRP